MPNPQIYTDALKTFTDKYGLQNYDYANLATIQEKFSYIDEFIMDSPTGRGAAGLFTALAAKTMSLYFENATELNENGKYMSSFNINDFLNDFDDLAQAKYESELKEGQEPKRAKFAGATSKQLLSALAKDYGKMNKTLPTLWFERLDSKKMSVDQIQGITNNVIDNLLAEDADNNEMEGQLVNVVAAHEAMKQLRQSREGFIGFFWKLFHRELNAKEEAYMNLLTTKVSELKNKGYNVDKVRDELNGKTVMGKAVKVEEKAKKTKKADTAKTSPKKTKNAAVKIGPIARRAEFRIDEGYHARDLIDELYDELPNNGQNKDMAKFSLENVYFKYVLEEVSKLNENFDKEIANGKDPQKAFETVVRGTFRKCLNYSKMYERVNKENILTGATIITKGIVNTFTAAAFYPKELGSLVDDCVDQNVAQYKSIEASGKDYEFEMDLLDDQMQDDNREKVFDNGNLFNDGYDKKSDRVDDFKKYDAPSLSNNK
jgi:hypothetical protein